MRRMEESWRRAREIYSKQLEMYYVRYTLRMHQIAVNRLINESDIMERWKAKQTADPFQPFLNEQPLCQTQKRTHSTHAEHPLWEIQHTKVESTSSVYALLLRLLSLRRWLFFFVCAACTSIKCERNFKETGSSLKSFVLSVQPERQTARDSCPLLIFMCNIGWCARMTTSE